MNDSHATETSDDENRNKLAYVSFYGGVASSLVFICGILISSFGVQTLFYSSFIGIAGGIIAAILGNTARAQIKTANGSSRDRRMATLGINLGLLPLLVLVFFCIYLVMFSPDM